MAASVNLPPAEQLPPRPSAAVMADYLDNAQRLADITGSWSSGAAEVLHLRAELEAKGSELDGLTYHAQEVTRAWMNVDRDELAADYPDLADALDELAEIGGAS